MFSGQLLLIYKSCTVPLTVLFYAVKKSHKSYLTCIISLVMPARPTCGKYFRYVWYRERHICWLILRISVRCYTTMIRHVRALLYVAAHAVELDGNKFVKLFKRTILTSSRNGSFMFLVLRKPRSRAHKITKVVNDWRISTMFAGVNICHMDQRYIQEYYVLKYLNDYALLALCLSAIHSGNVFCVLCNIRYRFGTLSTHPITRTPCWVL